MSSRIMSIHAQSPLHAGTGQSTGAIDLAIARNQATGVPLLPGSSIKGALRARAMGTATTQSVQHRDLFGPDTTRASEQAGAMAFGDAELLLLPVRTMRGTFAWVTSSWLLIRHNRDRRAAGLNALPSPRVKQSQCVLPVPRTESAVVDGAGVVHLEELDLRVDSAKKVQEAAAAMAEGLAKVIFPDSAAWQDLLKGKLVYVHDDMMAFLWHHALQIDARIAMNHETGTVKDGGLWHEESLPPETVLTSLVTHTPTRRATTAEGDMWDHLRAASTGLVQFGGKATVGRGRCQVTWVGGEA